MAKVTIASLEKEILELEVERNNLKIICNNQRDKDMETRTEFTNLIGVVKGTGQLIPGMQRKKETMSWPEIFFAIGELNADANMQCMKAVTDQLHQENEDLKFQIGNKERR